MTVRPFRADLKWLALIVLLSALLRIAAFTGFQDGLPVDFTHFSEFDNHTWHWFGVRIGEGDVLYRDAFVPTHIWARAIASPEEWETWYGGPSSYYQAPLYGYFVGLVYGISGPESDHVRVAQLWLGLVRILLVYLIARRFFGGWIPLLAALLTAFYVPFMVFELTILRVTLLMTLHLVALLLIVLGYQKRQTRYWALAGLVMGFEFLAKPSFYFLAPAILILLSGPRGRDRVRGLAAFAAMFAVALGLLVARNVTVGQPPLQVSTRGAVTFISGNAPQTVIEHPMGFFVPPSAPEILWKTGNSFPATVVEVMRRQAANPQMALRLWGEKAHAFWRDYEVPNNVNVYHFRNLIGPLRLPLPEYVLILPLALIGLLVTWKRRRDLAPLLLMMLLIFLYTILFIILSRMRLMIVPYLIIFAAAGLAWIGDALLHRRHARLVLASLIVIVTLTASARPDRWAPVTMSSRNYARELEVTLRLVQQMDPRIPRELTFAEADAMLRQVKVAYDDGRYEECIEPLMWVLESYPDLNFTRYVLARCCFESYLRDREAEDLLERAESELDLVLVREPGAPYAQGLVRALGAIRGHAEAEPSPEEGAGTTSPSHPE